MPVVSARTHASIELTWSEPEDTTDFLVPLQYRVTVVSESDAMLPLDDAPVASPDRATSPGVSIHEFRELVAVSTNRFVLDQFRNEPLVPGETFTFVVAARRRGTAAIAPSKPA